jgi:hypothetical protein
MASCAGNVVCCPVNVRFQAARRMTGIAAVIRNSCFLHCMFMDNYTKVMTGLSLSPTALFHNMAWRDRVAGVTLCRRSENSLFPGNSVHCHRVIVIYAIRDIRRFLKDKVPRVYQIHDTRFTGCHNFIRKSVGYLPSAAVNRLRINRGTVSGQIPTLNPA